MAETKTKRRYRGFAGLDYRNLKRLCEDKRYGPETLAQHVREGFERGDFKADDFHVRPLFEALVPDARELLLEWSSGGFSDGTRRVLEAGAVSSNMFSNITGQIVFSKVLDFYENEEFVFSKEVEEHNSRIIQMEKIGGIGGIGDEAEVVAEGMPFPYVGPVEDYIEAPAAQKRGDICALTWEAVFTDNTGQLLTRSGELGFYLGLNKEKRIIDCMVDEGSGAKSAVLGGHRYHWRNASYATFQTSTPYDNVTTSNALVDWSDIEAAELTLSRITDPNTGEVIMIKPDVVVVTKQLEYTASYILNSTKLLVHTGGYPTSGTPTEYETTNFIPKYRLLTSRLLETRMATDTDWYLGNLRKAFAYKVIRPLKVEQAPAGHPDEFDREIVTQFKASEFGTPYVQNPRLINESRS